MEVIEKRLINEKVVFPRDSNEVYNIIVYKIWDDDRQVEYRVELDWEGEQSVNEVAEISVYEDYDEYGEDGYVYDEELEKRIKDFIIEWENNQG
jgi:hypothetical protein